jgi:uncharacterized protein YfaS (alpha-2-macroglobulin family)
MKTTFARTLPLLLVIGLLSACRRDTEVKEEVTVPPATEMGPVVLLRVVDVDVGKSIGPDKRVNDNDETDVFRPNDTIYTSVNTDGSGNGTLSARWMYEDGQVVEEANQTVSGAAVTEFHISKPDGFPAGKYKVEIKLNGNVVETEDFEVKK